jgi:hypothetical protein
LLTSAGIVASICYAIAPFLGSGEIWMIEQDAVVCKSLVESVFTFTFDAAEVRLESESIVLALAVVESLVATRQGFAALDIIRELVEDKYRQSIAKVMAEKGPVADRLGSIVEIVQKEMLFKELAI